MSGLIEGQGFLCRERRLVAAVRYRLRWQEDPWGHSSAEGELLLPTSVEIDATAAGFVLHAEAGFSVPITLHGERRRGWLPFHRTRREEAHRAMG